MGLDLSDIITHRSLRDALFRYVTSSQNGSARSTVT
jgi:hypothetical protein